MSELDDHGAQKLGAFRVRFASGGKPFQQFKTDFASAPL